jgi:hypothetical protein
LHELQTTPFASRAELEKALVEAGWEKTSEGRFELIDHKEDLCLCEIIFWEDETYSIDILQAPISAVIPALLEKLGVAK